MARARLTAKNVHTLAAEDRARTVYFDTARSAPAGFCLRVGGDARAYYVTYRLNGRFCWYRLGSADVMKKGLSLSKAREEARTVLAKVQLGRDPQRERDDARAKSEKERAEGTLAALARDYLKVQETKLRKTTVAYYSWLIEKKVAGSPLGRMRASAVTAADVERHLAQVIKDAGGPTANRLHQTLTTVSRWAVKKGKLPVSFMSAVERPAVEQSRERVLSDGEIALLIAALKDETPTIAATVKLLLLLGQRATATIEGMTWASLALDAEIPTWTISGDYQKNKALHVVPLPPAVVKMIESLPKVGERVLDVDTVNYNRWWGPIVRRVIALGEENAIKVEHFTRHDLRRSCATGLTRIGVTRFIAERVIGHAETRGQRIASIYDRNDYLREKAAALAAWSAHVENVASGEKRRADVLPMARA
jgi:integrase